MKKSEEPCPECTTNIAMGFFFKICKESLSGKIDCKELTKQYVDGKINEEQVAERIKEAAKDDPELMEDLREIDRIRKTNRIEP